MDGGVSEGLKRVRVSNSELRVFFAICQHIDRHGWPPTFRELQDALGYRSVNYVSECVRRLQKVGLLGKGVGKARSFRPAFRVEVWDRPEKSLPGLKTA